VLSSGQISTRMTPPVPAAYPGNDEPPTYPAVAQCSASRRAEPEGRRTALAAGSVLSKDGAQEIVLCVDAGPVQPAQIRVCPTT
jgi:hypothetical protein